MTRSTRLRASDYETLLELLGQLGELRPDPLVRRQHAITSLARTFNARAALFMHTATVDGQYGFFDPITMGFDECPKDELEAYFSGQLPFDPCTFPMEDRAPGANITHLRHELTPDDVWRRCEHYNGFRRLCRLDDAVYARVLAHGHTFGMCFLRELGDPPLTERERDMLHTFNTHAARLYCLDQPLDASPLCKLAPRLRPVARRFMEGDSVKQAARHLGLSVHTVAEYSKLIYRTFNVSSRSELLLALLRRPQP